MIQLHPIDNFDLKVNYWLEYPSYKVHSIFGEIYRINKKENLEKSSRFMWLLALCYDRKSAIYSQPELDKWEVSGEQLFDDEHFMVNLLEAPEKCKVLLMPPGMDLRDTIIQFEKSIDTPLGISLRRLEKKLDERTTFITDTEYSVDYYEQVGNKNVLKKGSADQLDRMFAATEKINGIILSAMDSLKASETAGSTKGGQKESLSDGNKSF